jgi:hypothetical protein
MCSELVVSEESTSCYLVSVPVFRLAAAPSRSVSSHAADRTSSGAARRLYAGKQLAPQSERLLGETFLPLDSTGLLGRLRALTARRSLANVAAVDVLGSLLVVLVVIISSAVHPVVCIGQKVSQIQATKHCLCCSVM